MDFRSHVPSSTYLDSLLTERDASESDSDESNSALEECLCKGRKETFVNLSPNVRSMKHIHSSDKIRDVMTSTIWLDLPELQEDAERTPNEAPSDLR